MAKGVKKNKNQARLVITFDIELSKEEMAKSPAHLQDATDILRDLLVKEDWQSAFEYDAFEMSNDDMKVTSVKVEVAK